MIYNFSFLKTSIYICKEQLYLDIFFTLMRHFWHVGPRSASSYTALQIHQAKAHTSIYIMY